MNKPRDNTIRRNSSIELSPEEAKKKREELLERARKEAEERGEKPPEQDNPEDSSLATFILPGD